jgi:hypothetical protein
MSPFLDRHETVNVARGLPIFLNYLIKGSLLMLLYVGV